MLPDDFERPANRLGTFIGPLSEIILSLSACLAFLSATGPEAKGEDDLAKLILRAREEDDEGDECLPDLYVDEDEE